MENISEQEFVDAVYGVALNNEINSGVPAPAPVTTAQAVQESYYGRSVMKDIHNNRYGFNLFGVKAKAGQNYVENWTTKFVNGIKFIDKFALYSSFEESIADHTRFLKENKRYSSLSLSKIPEEWAKGLEEKGYATDPNYANNLILIMKGGYMKSRGLK